MVWEINEAAAWAALGFLGLTIIILIVMSTRQHRAERIERNQKEAKEADEWHKKRQDRMDKFSINQLNFVKPLKPCDCFKDVGGGQPGLCSICGWMRESHCSHHGASMFWIGGLPCSGTDTCIKNPSVTLEKRVIALEIQMGLDQPSKKESELCDVCGIDTIYLFPLCRDCYPVIGE